MIYGPLTNVMTCFPEKGRYGFEPPAYCYVWRVTFPQYPTLVRYAYTLSPSVDGCLLAYFSNYRPWQHAEGTVILLTAEWCDSINRLHIVRH